MDQSHTKRGFQAAEYAAENKPQTAIKLRVHIAVGTDIDRQRSIMVARVDTQIDGSWPDHSCLSQECVALGYPTMHTVETELPIWFCGTNPSEAIRIFVALFTGLIGQVPISSFSTLAQFNRPSQ